MPEMRESADFATILSRMTRLGEAFAVATVVRTISATAAKPGAKAIIDKDGDIVEGWIGGGCARHAVVNAAKKAIVDGRTRLVSIQPEELLEEQGLVPGEEAGLVVARNMCPSKGTMEIFVEPMLTNPVLRVIGDSPVARTLADLATVFDFKLRLDSDASGSSSREEASASNQYIIIATQGRGDLAALELALRLPSRYIGFVGSARKFTHLREKLIAAGHAGTILDSVSSPAGLDIGGVTPQEIALSILAEIIRLRRATLRDQR